MTQQQSSNGDQPRVLQLYECLGCGGVYSVVISECDCRVKAPFEYRTLTAMPSEHYDAIKSLESLKLKSIPKDSSCVAIFLGEDVPPSPDISLIGEKIRSRLSDKNALVLLFHGDTTIAVGGEKAISPARFLAATEQLRTALESVKERLSEAAAERDELLGAINKITLAIGVDWLLRSDFDDVREVIDKANKFQVQP